MTEQVFLIGGGQIQRLIGPRGKTPPCPQAKFKRGDVVKVRNTKALANFPREAVVAVAIPPGFSPDHALADLVGEPRALMAQVGAAALAVATPDPTETAPDRRRRFRVIEGGK